MDSYHCLFTVNFTFPFYGIGKPGESCDTFKKQDERTVEKILKRSSIFIPFMTLPNNNHNYNKMALEK